ncbi:MAG: hypothetical protein ABIT06_08555 [Saprospiraceae bacterium]
MDEAEFYQKFYITLAIVGVIVLIAATLLILILIAARRILKLANAALGIVINIKQNTLCIWELQNTNHKAVDILNEADTILSNAGAVAQALHDTEK